MWGFIVTLFHICATNTVASSMCTAGEAGIVLAASLHVPVRQSVCLHRTKKNCWSEIDVA